MINVPAYWKRVDKRGFGSIGGRGGFAKKLETPLKKSGMGSDIKEHVLEKK